MILTNSCGPFAPKENVPDNVSGPTLKSENVTKSRAINQNSNNEHPCKETEREFE
jgi:hypothetical protein